MIHIISYGDDKYKRSKERIHAEAVATGWFDTVSVYGPDDLDDEFKSKFKNILSYKRGGGYWIWKLYIINKKISEIDEDDILIYLDAGCKINPEGKTRFNEYIDMLNDSDLGIISFELDKIEKEWTTKETFDHLDVKHDSKIANTNQLVGTVRIMKKNFNLMRMLDLEMKTLHANPLLFTDCYNKNQKSPFKDHRHDQSIFSVIRKMSNTILLKDETWFGGRTGGFGTGKSNKYPFWATRQK